MKTNLKRYNDGFTIIEVLIVLAIAAAILLVVFLAVPGLQRSSNNNAAKTDAAHIATALSTYVSNNNGTLPTASTMGTVYGDVSGLSKLTASPAPVDGTALVSVNKGDDKTNTWYFDAGAVTTVAQTSQIWVVDVDTGVLCGSTTYGSMITTTTTGATASSIALLYTTEASSGSTWNCIQAE
jgi:prepilin-type N-terminal cleavage/methylation domain-containing protein